MRLILKVIQDMPAYRQVRRRGVKLEPGQAGQRRLAAGVPDFLVFRRTHVLGRHGSERLAGKGAMSRPFFLARIAAQNESKAIVYVPFAGSVAKGNAVFQGDHLLREFHVDPAESGKPHCTHTHASKAWPPLGDPRHSVPATMGSLAKIE